MTWVTDCADHGATAPRQRLCVGAATRDQFVPQRAHGGGGGVERLAGRTEVLTDGSEILELDFHAINSANARN